jgi:hypothetical protein
MPHKIKIKQVDLSGVTQDNTKTRFLVIDSSGNLSWNNSPQSGSAGISGLNFYDEGVLVGTYAKVNFVGPGVLADENPTNSDTINVYIPPPAYASHFNTTDGTTNGLVAESGISKANVRISSPTTEGNPFYTGGGVNALWAGGVHPAHLVSNGSTLNFNTLGAVTGFGGNSTITANLISGDGVTVLATFTTPAVTANGTWSSIGVNAGITVQVFNYASDGLKNKAEVEVNIDLYSMFSSPGTLGLDGGRYHVVLVHTTDTATDGGINYTYTQADAFIDINPSTPSFGATSSVTITESSTPNNIVTRHISGVEYYTIGSQFEATATELNNINANTQGRQLGANTNFRLTAPNYGLSAITQSVWAPTFGTFTGWNNNHNDTNDSYAVTNWTIPSTSFRYRGDAGTASATLFDPWAASSPKNSAANLILIDTVSGGSSQYVETFNDETFRTQSDYSTSWISTSSLVNGEACVVGGTLVRPDRYYLTTGVITPNLTLYKPDKGGANPNYTGFSNDASFYRSFYTTLSASTVPIPSFSIVFAGTFVGTALSDLQNSHLRIFVRKIGATVGNFGTSSPPLLLHGADYDFGTFNDGSTSGTDTPGIRVGSSIGNTIDGTFGGFNATNGIYIEIQIRHQSIRIDTVTVTFN